MIIDNTYFKGDIYIPHANPSITDDIISTGNDLSHFINEYEKDCLVKCLGYNLFTLFSNEIDETKDNKLKDSSDEKWNFLLNGHSYLKDGKTAIWEGIRFKSAIGDSASYDMSFLANYVYYFFESNYNVTRSSVGNVKPKGKNADIVNPTGKVIKAWRKFVEQVQGVDSLPNVSYKLGLACVDWYGDSGKINLYQFIRDMNDVESDYYPEFNPKAWVKSNQFGI